MNQLVRFTSVNPPKVNKNINPNDVEEEEMMGVA